MFAHHRRQLASCFMVRIRARLQTCRSSQKKRASAPVMALPLRRAEPANIIAGDRTFFVTSSVMGKRSMLQSSRSAQLLIEVLYYYRSQYKYRLHSFVIMPDHFHALITVGHEITLNASCNSLKEDLPSVREENCNSGRRFGSAAFQKYGFMTQQFSHAFVNT
jgi:REP element-mobilizing transposase RayT